MAYSGEPTRVSRRSKAPLLALLALAAVIVGFAALAGNPPSRPDTAVLATAAATGPSAPSPQPARAAVPPDSVPPPASSLAAARGNPPRGFPVHVPAAIVRCHRVERADCLRIADSAAGAIVDAGEQLGAIRAVDVWSSLLCNDSLVCPVPLLRRVVPLGSAVVSITGSSTDAWVNVGVVRTPPFRPPAEATPPVDGAASPPLEAWIVR